MSDIPVEILEEGILSILPAKSLMRFRCVSKHWRDLIDSSDFAKLHSKKAQELGRFHKLILHRNSATFHFSIDVDSLDHSHPLKPRIFHSEFSDSDSRNGFILLVDENNDSLVIWNPFTRKHTSLPPHNMRQEENNTDLTTTVMDTKYGFWYDSSKDDYNVFIAKVLESEGWQIWTMGWEAKVYCLKSNTWKQTEFHSMNGVSGRWVVKVNGALHTVTHRIAISNALN